MDAPTTLSSLHYELKIVNAKNIQVTISSGHLFVRCYLSIGNNKRVCLDTQKVLPKRDLSWNKSFSLDYMGTKQSMDMIIHGIIVLELRWSRNTIACFKESKRLGKTVLSWKDVFETPNMEIQKWVTMESKKKDIKEPSIRIVMKIEAPFRVGLVERKKNNNKWDENYGCCHGDCCDTTYVDGEAFLIGDALGAFEIK